MPQKTRLRFVSSKDPGIITLFFKTLAFRVQIYDIVHDGKKWFCWFVPPDEITKDVDSVDLDAV